MTDLNQKITTLQHLLDYDARKFTNAEIQLKKSLPGWIGGAGSLSLKTVLQKYLGFVEEHIEKLEGFISAENISSLSTDNRIMKAFIEETNEKLNDCTDQEVKDASLLASIQAITHFKISMYGTAAAFAKILDMEKFADAFHETELHEKQIDERLNQLAATGINTHANAPFALKV